MVTENGRAELRGLYIDPALPLTIAVGQAFDLVSMPAAVGHAALTALRARRVRLGPVVADSRRSVMRVGFLVAPAPEDQAPVAGHAGHAGHAETAALREWAGRLGGALGVRVGGRGSTATLPPLLPWRGWLHWLVPPGGAAVLWTPAGALLSVLSEPTGARLL
ncbi:hypothetical protein [Catenulispora rubra]|uniref:hypothetical protein n=1 Tax=Catenulispora rubra TaxID=280293 RepID=UPI0018923EA1|nr:hypothetical protein [Catenulispora rubra]